MTRQWLDHTRFEARLPVAFFARLQDRVRSLLEAAGLDAFLTEDPEDVAYLTGFFHHPGERPVAVWLDQRGCLLLLPDLEREHAESQRTAADLVSYAEFPGLRPPWASLAKALGTRVGTVGFNVGASVRRVTAFQHAIPAAGWRPSELMEQARMIKFDEEITLHAEAARITDQMLAAGVHLVQTAIAERGLLPSEAELSTHVGQVGTRVMYAEHREVVVVSMLAGGLVYAGANSAHPHGLPSGNRLRNGDTFMLSLGCAVGGRFVEGERTFVLGAPNAEQRHFHDTVHAAQQIGATAIRPGVACSEANRRCLQVIIDSGLGAHLRHRQGHGIGLGMHEPPWLADGDDTVLAERMIVSNEPGIYVPGHAGYRISDSMLVTPEGSRPLTSYPRDLESCTIDL